MLDPMDARALTLAGHVRGYLGRRPEEAAPCMTAPST